MQEQQIAAFADDRRAWRNLVVAPQPMDDDDPNFILLRRSNVVYVAREVPVHEKVTEPCWRNLEEIITDTLSAVFCSFQPPPPPNGKVCFILRFQNLVGTLNICVGLTNMDCRVGQHFYWKLVNVLQLTIAARYIVHSELLIRLLHLSWLVEKWKYQIIWSSREGIGLLYQYEQVQINNMKIWYLVYKAEDVQK